MFAYCGNDPVLLSDCEGTIPASSEQISNAITGAVLRIINTATYIAFMHKASSCELSDEQKIFVATIAAEAGIAANGKPVSRIARQAMAFVAMNRIHGKDWATYDNVADICKYTGFSGYGSANYYLCMDYLNNRDRSNSFYETIITDVIMVYNHDITDFTCGSVLYFTPAAMKPLGSIPYWNYSELEEILIEGVDTYYEGRFYRYK